MIWSFFVPWIPLIFEYFIISRNNLIIMILKYYQNLNRVLILLLDYINFLFLFFKINSCYPLTSYGNVVAVIIILNLSGTSEFPQPFISLSYLTV